MKSRQEPLEGGGDETKGRLTTMNEERDWLALGHEKFRLGDYAGAIADYSKAIALKPTDIAYYSRGLAYLGIVRKEKAREDLMKAMELGYHVPKEAMALCGEPTA